MNRKSLSHTEIILFNVSRYWVMRIWPSESIKLKEFWLKLVNEMFMCESNLETTSFSSDALEAEW